MGAGKALVWIGGIASAVYIYTVWKGAQADAGTGGTTGGDSGAITPPTTDMGAAPNGAGSTDQGGNLSPFDQAYLQILQDQAQQQTDQANRLAQEQFGQDTQAKTQAAQTSSDQGNAYNAEFQRANQAAEGQGNLTNLLIGASVVAPVALAAGRYAYKIAKPGFTGEASWFKGASKSAMVEANAARVSQEAVAAEGLASNVAHASSLTAEDLRIHAGGLTAEEAATYAEGVKSGGFLAEESAALSLGGFIAKAAPVLNVAAGAYQGVQTGLQAKRAGYGQAQATEFAAIGAATSAATWGLASVSSSKDRNAVNVLGVPLASKERETTYTYSQPRAADKTETAGGITLPAGYEFNDPKNPRAGYHLVPHKTQTKSKVLGLTLPW